MIQDIAPHKLDNQFRHVEPQRHNVAFTFQGQKALFIMGGDTIQLPTMEQLPGGFERNKDKAIYLFSVDDEPVFLVLEKDLKGEVPANMKYDFLQKVYNITEGWVPLACFTANHLNHWYSEHHFCGSCGSVTIHSETERAKVCPECGNIRYPRINPVIMAAITDGERLLVTRYKGRSYKGLALNAGFVEIGESMEEAVVRECMEEVGLRVGNLRYFGSQPWGLSDSVISGYFAYLEGDDKVTLDKDELAEAIWMTREELPEQMDIVSITAAMIEAFRTGKI